MLQSKFLNLALEYLCFKPEIYLCTNNIMIQFGKYSAFWPDPGAIYIDTVSISWSGLKRYAFSPISVVPSFLLKVKQDSATLY